MRARAGSSLRATLHGALLVCAWALAGCGPVLYTARLDAAEASLEQARNENARWYAPYEYYYAEAHLEQAREEAADAAYEDAIRYARTAESFSRRAIELTAKRKEVER
jgi:hypothetical protein